MPGFIALTREVSPAIAQCELTHLARAPIDVGIARLQHGQYERALTSLGCTVQRLPSSSDMPDSVFIEDIAIVLDELAIVTRPGAESRRIECAVVEDAVERYRPVARIESPGTLDGGDVLVLGKAMFIGLSSRTNHAAIDQTRTLVAPFGYSVDVVTLTGCLHLKSAVTAVSSLDGGVVLLNPAWVRAGAFGNVDVIDVHPDEPYAANVVCIGDELVYPVAFPRTRDRLERRGFRVTMVDVSELAKAEGAVTCCSVIFRAR